MGRGQRDRIIAFAERHEAAPKPARQRHLALDLGLAGRRHALPAARDSSGSAAKASPAPPKRLTKPLKVRGPTRSVRISLSQSKR